MKLKLILLFSFAAISQARFVKRIVGGRDAEPNSFPNVVSLQVFENDPRKGLHFSSGIIINPLWILISAKCAAEIGVGSYPKENIKIFAGKWNLSNFEPNQQIRKIKQTFVHPNFDDDLQESNDVGLIELTVALIMNQYVKAFALSTEEDYPSGNAVIAGWGSAYLNEVMLHKPTAILQAMNVTIVSREDCLDSLKELLKEHDEAFDPHRVHESIFCTDSYTTVTGSSFFDVSNPVMQPNKSGDYNVIGITSVCGGPSLYVHLAPFLDWINVMTSI